MFLLPSLPKKKSLRKKIIKLGIVTWLSNCWLIALLIVIIILIFYIENRKSRKAKARLESKDLNKGLCLF